MPNLFMVGVLCFMVLFVAADVWALVRWRKVWRFVAALPGLALVLCVVRLAFDLWVNPASHNMWPFELVWWSGAGLLVLAALWFLQMFVNHGQVIR
jgi:hypothetical protein